MLGGRYPARGSPEPGFCAGDSGISSPVIRGETRLGRFAGAGFLLRADQTYKPRMLRFHGGSPGEVSPRGFLRIGCGVRRHSWRRPIHSYILDDTQGLGCDISHIQAKSRQYAKSRWR